MGYVVEISDDKAHEMAEHAEKVLKHGGKLMRCIEELCEDSRFAERGGRYGMRADDGRYNMRDDDRYRDRMGYRDEEHDWDDDGYDRMSERRGRSMRTGRYVRR